MTFNDWLKQLDLEVQWRKKVHLYDLGINKKKLRELFVEDKTVEEAANEISSGTN